MYQLFVKGLDGKSRCLQIGTPEIRAAELKSRLSDVLKIPASLQRLVTGTANLCDESVLRASGGEFPSVNVLLRLRAGKGGFGSLLRGAATKGWQKKTNNFDACRDMSGRRLRHVNAEKKLQQWLADAEERKLEQVAEEYIKKRAKNLQADGKSKISAEGARAVQIYRDQTEKATDGVRNAVSAALKLHANGKRKSLVHESDVTLSKRPRLSMLEEDEDEIGEDEDSDEDSDDGAEDVEAKVRLIVGGLMGNETNNGAAEKAVEEKTSEDSVSEQEGSKDDSSDTSNSDNAADRQTSPVFGKEKTPVVYSGENENIVFMIFPRASEKQDATVHSYSGDDHTTGKSPDQIQESTISEVADNSYSTSSVHQQEIESVCDSNGSSIIEMLNIDNYSSATEMESLGLERLKIELQARGLKCGGSLSERAARLFLLKTTPLESLPKKLFAKTK